MKTFPIILLSFASAICVRGDTAGRLVFEDAREEIYRVLDAPDAETQFVFTFFTGNHPSAPARGHFSLEGADRSWISGSTNRPANVLQALPSDRGDFGVAHPAGPALLRRVRAQRDGTFSAGISFPAFNDDAGRALPDSGGRRTAAVIYNQPGMAALITVVEATKGLAERRQVWKINVGAVPFEALTIDGLSFRVTPPESKYSMSGMVVYPATAMLRSHAGDDGAQVEIFREKPGASINDIFNASFDAYERQLALLLSGSGEDTEKPDALSITLVEPGIPTHVREDVIQQQQLLFFKMLQATSSSKMGGGDRSGWARAGWIVVIAVHPRNQPPAVRVAEQDDPALFYIGSTAVSYDEYLITYSSTAGSTE